MTSARDLSNRERRFSLSGEPARGLAASRRPFGDVRFSGSPDRWCATPAEQRSASMPPYRKSHTNQPTTKVSTLSQDLTERKGDSTRASEGSRLSFVSNECSVG